MKIKGPKARLRITEIEPQEGLRIPVILRSGKRIFLPVDQVDFKTDELEGQVAVIPLWLKKKVI